MLYNDPPSGDRLKKRGKPLENPDQFCPLEASSFFCYPGRKFVCETDLFCTSLVKKTGRETQSPTSLLLTSLSQSCHEFVFPRIAICKRAPSSSRRPSFGEKVSHSQISPQSKEGRVFSSLKIWLLLLLRHSKVSYGARQRPCPPSSSFPQVPNKSRIEKSRTQKPKSTQKVVLKN